MTFSRISSTLYLTAGERPLPLTASTSCLSAATFPFLRTILAKGEASAIVIYVIAHGKDCWSGYPLKLDKECIPFILFFNCSSKNSIILYIHFMFLPRWGGDRDRLISTINGQSGWIIPTVLKPLDDTKKIQKKIFLTKLKGHPNLYVTGKFFYSQYKDKKKNFEGTEDLFFYRRIFVKSVFARTIFDCMCYLSCHIWCLLQNSLSLTYPTCNPLSIISKISCLDLGVKKLRYANIPHILVSKIWLGIK